jgi:hypothetical protein
MLTTAPRADCILRKSTRKNYSLKPVLPCCPFWTVLVISNPQEVPCLPAQGSHLISYRRRYSHSNHVSDWTGFPHLLTMFMRFLTSCFVISLLFLLVAPAHSQNLGFDLMGPPVDVKVERRGKALPISEVPNLQPGDRLWLHPDFPDSQSVHYLLIVAFLRGSTNPPPDEWFTKAETWDRSVRQEGIFVIVPKEAQQALIFLAPQAMGDFGTLRSAVRGRPGAFVRSSQDLQQAGFDRARLERYLGGIKSISESAPKELQQHSVLLAHTLKIKVDEKCFDRPIEQQYTCLTHNPDQLILDDANSQNMLARVSNGATADLMNQISYSRLGGGGAYSAYIGAIIDFGRIMGSLHTAQYQYIPALALPRGESLSLRLNNPPSFRKPQSVMVVALPPVQPASVPMLHALEPSETYCLGNPSLVLPAEAAPLLFATQYAHDMFLHVEDGAGKSAELPAFADPAHGGFDIRIDDTALDQFQSDLTGTIHGMWGFDQFQGPKFRLQLARPEKWTLAPSDETALIVGREDLLHVYGQSVACVSGINMIDPDGETKPLTWKTAKPHSIEIKVPLENQQPGPVTLAVSQYGLSKAYELSTQSYEEAAQFDRFVLNLGDTKGTLEGKRLDEVAKVELESVDFEPGDLKRRTDHDELLLRTQSATDDLQAGQASANVMLKDGRSFKLPASILPSRPRVTLISKGVQNVGASASAIQIGSNDELPTTGQIVFSLKAIVPPVFPREEQIEVAAVDDSFHAILKTSNGTLVLQDSQTALGTIDPEKTFGNSAFGPLQFRAIAPDGTPGDWHPLGTLVRLPELHAVLCPTTNSAICMLSGKNLFLLSAISSNANFEGATLVPDGFTGQELPIRRPEGSSLYLKIRDDPKVVQAATVPLVHEPAAPMANPHAYSKSKTRNESY